MARILIAEDDEALRGLVMRALGEDGHELTATADGAAGARRAAPSTTANSTCCSPT